MAIEIERREQVILIGKTDAYESEGDVSDG